MILLPRELKKVIRKWISSLAEYDSKKYRSYRSHADPLLSPWLFDQVFLEDYEKAVCETGAPRHYQDGRYILTRLVCQALLSQKGDLIECGVHTGTSSYLIASMMDRYSHPSAKLFSIDSFEGFPPPSAQDENPKTKKQFFHQGGHSNTSFETVKRTLQLNHCSSIQVIQGWIPETFVKVDSTELCFAHIDVDLYYPTLHSLEFIYSRMIGGGIVLIDDYGFPMCGGAKQAVDEFLRNKPDILIPIPSGQAFFIKH
jgi:O-methyltransferase